MSESDAHPYRDAAWHYAEYRDQVHPGFVDRLADFLAWNAHTRVLDLCCGPAHLAIPLARRVGQIVAVDVEPAMLAEGQRRVGVAGVDGITFVEGRAEDAPRLVTGRFDAVTIGWGFHWLSNHTALLDNLAQIVNDEGAIVIIGDPFARARTARATGRTPHWSDRLDEILGRYLVDTTDPQRPPAPTESYRDLLQASPFNDVSDVTFEYEAEHYDTLDAALGFRYSLAGVRERLGARLQEFEDELRLELRHVQPTTRLMWRHDHGFVGRKVAP
jgi:ubiquinone/menaquinone biosynthesis C-methylase UbiE